MRRTQENTLEAIVEDILIREFRYLRTYTGMVVNVIDPLAKGRILCTVAALNWTTPDVGAWCYPRQTNSITTPGIGTHVEIAFNEQNVDKIYYIGQIPEVGGITGEYPSKWKKLSTSHVLWQSPLPTGGYITADDITNIINISSLLGVHLGKGTEPMVKGLELVFELGELLAWLLQLQTILAAWVPVPLDGGTALKTALTPWLSQSPPLFADILSLIHKLD